MSSSNLVRLAFIEESVLGETPVAGNFSTARFTSESLSGTPGTTESQQIRSDRMSSGQIVTSLEVGGEVNFELAKEGPLDLFMASAMMNAWSVAAPVTVDLEIDIAAKTIERASGDFNVDLDVGDIFSTTNFLSLANNTQFQVLQIVSPTVIRVSIPAGVTSEVGVGTTFKRADRLSIGTTKKSFSMEKSFVDLTTKALIYKGMLASQMSLSVNYGEIVNGAFEFSGTGYEAADAAGEFITNARTVVSPATTNSMNGSIDMPFISSSAVGLLSDVDFCIQSLGIELNNNLQAQNCIGEVAPKDYSAGTAAISVDLSAYLANGNWSLLAKKLSQESFAIGFMLKNIDGWYGFYLPAVQVSFDDPGSSGANQEISLEMSGTAKVGDSGESALYIYRS